MSEHGYTVDHPAMIKAVNQLAQIQGHAAGILDLAKDANPEWYIWGILGAPFAAWYWSVADEVYKHLEMMGQALADRVDSLQKTADNYKGVEDALHGSIKSIEDLLG